MAVVERIAIGLSVVALNPVMMSDQHSTVFGLRQVADSDSRLVPPPPNQSP